MRVSVVVPVYRNEEKFLEIFSRNLPFFSGLEIVIVDDYPLSNLKQRLPQTKNLVYLKNKKNLGFSGAVNKGVRKAKGEFILLLNSDVQLLDSKFLGLIDDWKRDIFAVSFLQLQDNKKHGRNLLFFKKGLFFHKAVEELKFGITSWAEGGAVLFRKKDFLDLGGFFEIYSPFYWEDIDLSYRAWKSGFKVYFTDKVKVLHKHETTIAKYFKRAFINFVSFRNQFIFTWINLTDPDKLLQHFIFLFPNLITTFFHHPEVLLAFFAALFNLPKILFLRFKVKRLFKRSDEEVLSIFKKQIR